MNGVAPSPIVRQTSDNNITNNVQSTNTRTHIRNIFHPYCARHIQRRRHQLARPENETMHISFIELNSKLFFCSLVPLGAMRRIRVRLLLWARMLNAWPSSLEISRQPNRPRAAAKRGWAIERKCAGRKIDRSAKTMGPARAHRISAEDKTDDDDLWFIAIHTEQRTFKWHVEIPNARTCRWPVFRARCSPNSRQRGCLTTMGQHFMCN